VFKVSIMILASCHKIASVVAPVVMLGIPKTTGTLQAVPIGNFLAYSNMNLNRGLVLSRIISSGNSGW